MGLFFMGFNDFPYRHANISFKYLAKVVAAVGEINDGIGEIAWMPEQCTEEKFPVVAASTLQDAHVPYRAE